MTQLPTTTSPSETALYRRGIASDVAARGLLRRFLPACAGVLGTMVLVPITVEPDRTSSLLPLVTIQIAGLTVGFGLGLECLRRWLYPDANIDGRRSLVCGLASPLVLGIASFFTQGMHSLVKISAVCAVAGCSMAAVMFLAWLRPTPGHEALESAALPTSAPEQLAGT